MNTPPSSENLLEFEFDTLEGAQWYRRAIVRQFRQILVGRVLEVGAGVGQITELLAAVPGVDEVVALEPEGAFIDKLRRRAPAARTIQGSSRDLPADESFHAILMVNVLEHIENDVEELSRLRTHLSPAGGAVGIFVPARPELYSTMDAAFGHYRRYTRTTLRESLTLAGYVCDAVYYFNLVGYFCWLVNFTLRGQTRFAPELVRFFDRFVFRTSDAVESRLGRPPIGQSVVAIARPASS